MASESEKDPRRNGIEKETCIVLRAVPYGEADLILTLFSRTSGRIEARAWGARSIRSAYRAACQPFCASEMEFYVRRGHRSVRAADIKSEFFGIQGDYKKYAVGCVLLELTEKVLVYGQEDEYEKLFRLLAATLAELEHTHADPQYLLLFFLIRVVHMLGIYPSLHTCVACGATVEKPNWWSATQGGVLCDACGNSDAAEEYPKAAAQCVGAYGRAKPGSEHDLATGIAGVRGAIRLLLDLLSEQLGIRLNTMKGVR